MLHTVHLRVTERRPQVACQSVESGGTKMGTDPAAGARHPSFDRRVFLGGALALGAGALASACSSPATVARAASTPPAGSDLGAIEHVVFLMQENRSFDHYFGSYRGVRGFDDHRGSD